MYPHSRPTCVPKDSERDRFIVDRRGRDGSEGKLLGGQSSRILQGAKLGEMFDARVQEKEDIGRDLNNVRLVKPPEVLQRRGRNLASGQLHTITIRRVADTVSVQVTYSISYQHF